LLMAKKKLKRKKKLVAKKKVTPKKKAAAKKKVVAKKKAIKAKKPARLKRRPRGRASNTDVQSAGLRGFGPGAAGQSGDLQGLSRKQGADSESVEELLEEGQSFEAEAVSGAEDALDPDESEVTTKEVPEDDVPDEELDNQ
jgi:hypothetical protein